MPEAARWHEGVSRTYAELFADVTRTANLLFSLGVRRGDAVALLAPNGAESITATLAAQVAGVAAPINAGLSAEHIVELLKRSGPRCSCAPAQGSTRGCGPSRRQSPAPSASKLSCCSDRSRPSWSATPMRPRSSTSPRRQRHSRRRRSRASCHERPTSPRSSTPAEPRGRPSWRRTPTRTRWSTHGPSPRSRCSTTTRSSSPDCPSST